MILRKEGYIFIALFLQIPYYCLLYSTLTFFLCACRSGSCVCPPFCGDPLLHYLSGRVCKTESCSHNSLPVLKPAGNIIPVLTGSYVIFGLCSCGFRIFFCFSRCCCIRPYLPGFFLWQWLSFHFGDFWFFRSIDFRQFFVCLGFLVSFSHFFSGSMPENIRLFTRIFIRSGMTVRNIRFFFLKKQGTSGKTGLRDLCCYIARAKQNCQRDP